MRKMIQLIFNVNNFDIFCFYNQALIEKWKKTKWLHNKSTRFGCRTVATCTTGWWSRNSNGLHLPSNGCPSSKSPKILSNIALSTVRTHREMSRCSIFMWERYVVIKVRYNFRTWKTSMRVWTFLPRRPRWRTYSDSTMSVK